MMEILDRRAGTQRGKSRSRTPASNPLEAWIFDMDCAWPMYRQPHNKSFRYACGLYYQSHAQHCSHNTLDGPTAIQFLLGCVRRRLLRPGLRSKLERRLRQMAEAAQVMDRRAKELAAARAALAEVERQLPVVWRNMAMAATEDQRLAMAAVFEELQARKRQVAADVVAADRAAGGTRDAAGEVAAAMAVAHRLTDLAADPENLARVGELFRQINARLFVRFREVPQGKRLLRKPASGYATFGDAEPPINLCAGRTMRQKVKEAAASLAPASGDLQ